MTAGLIGLVVLCILLYTGQTFLNRLFAGAYPGKADSASLAFSVIYGVLVCFVTFLLNGCVFSPSRLTVILGIANGFILFFYNLGMIQAGRRGPYTIQSIVMLFGSIVVCLCFAALYWGDRVTPLQLAGIAVMLAAFVALNSGGTKTTAIKKGFFFWVASLFFTNGFYGVLMDAQQRLIANERNEMIMVTFGTLAVIAVLYQLIRREDLKAAYGMGRRAWVYAVLCSVCAAFAVFTLMILLRYIPSYILLTIANGSILVINTLLSATVLKEKLSKVTIVGVILSAVSIVMLSL